MGAADSILRQAINIRGLNHLRPHAAEVAIAHVIGEDDEDVWGRGRARQRERTEERKQGKRFHEMR